MPKSIRQSVSRCSACISLLLLLIVTPLRAQSLLPIEEGSIKRYTANVDMPKGYISGICTLMRQDQTILGSIFNEFGVTMIGFVYYPSKDKVKLLSLNDKLDKWYVRRVMKADLRQLIHALDQGKLTCQDAKYHITFNLSLLNDSPTPIIEDDETQQ